ncbi:hypothetical protein RFI_35798 [Reticulomyxa filosa]|uniref:Uncharacterized protein n=1 Tax=Reticulomyxa filosa TaxID=46433 RepID=X6LKH5_RETFI|nr:hypothetical protein RFI_35798 [Reticulomyxa filosa]|eukprot:ETO01642.1 hypothetical protein RFI_35798 [Reticulomyxa filosa]
MTASLATDNNKTPSETLALKKHWSTAWIRSNIEAAKLVKGMLDKNEQGLIIITNNISEWKNKIHLIHSNEINENSFCTLINNENIEKEQMEDYWIYTIKRKLIIIDDDIVIDGNIYIVDCEIKLQENVQITTQVFITNNAMINQQELKQKIVPIQWDIKIHCYIPVILQDLEDKKQQCLQENCFTDAFSHAQEHLQICVDNFGSKHPFVANSYNYLGLICEECDVAIECYKKALKISLDSFGINHPWIANICNHLGNEYGRNKQYDEAIEYCEKALAIRLHNFGINHISVARSYDDLGVPYFYTGQHDKAIKCLQKELDILLHIFKKDHIHIAFTYENLGFVFGDKQMYSKSIEYHENSLQIKKEYLEI